MDNNLPVLASSTRLAPREQGDDNIELLKLWRTVWNRRVGVLALTGVITLVTIVAVYSMTPVYRAASTLLIDEKGAKAVTFDPVSGGSDNNATQYMETQAELIQSRSLAETVVKELDLTSAPEFDDRQQSHPLAFIGNALAAVGFPESVTSRFNGGKEQSEEMRLARVTQEFMKSISVEPQGKSQLALLQVDLEDPRLAMLAANALAKAFIESQQETAMGTSTNATKWMNTRLVELGEKLKDSEARLQAYRESENLVDVQGVGTISASQLSLTSERMIDARRQRAEAESQYRQVQNQGRGGWQGLASEPAVLADPLIQQFKSQQALAQAKVDQLSGRYGPEHPNMIAARTELSAASAALKSQVEQVVAGIQRNYQLAVANERSLQASFELNKNQIQDISRKEFRVQELQREVESNRTLYDTFMTRIKETAATADIDSANTRIIDPAVMPAAPIKPKKTLIIAIAAFMGLLIGAALALLLEALNNTFKSVEQVEEHLNIPVMGILPLMKRGERKDLARMFHNGKYNRFNESIRTIRTNVLLSGYEKPHQVIVVTSSVPGEGKSTVSINLAQALGQMERVLLIDADLRRPSLGKQFGLPANRLGLSNLIAGTATFEECLVTIDGVDVLCAGTAADNPLELLSSPRFAKALELLKSKYPRIIIDSSPTQAVSDSKVLATLAESVIYVVKAASTSIPLAEKGVAQLLQHKAPVRGIVINQVNIDKSAQYGHRFDGFYDYHGYSKTTS